MKGNVMNVKIDQYRHEVHLNLNVRGLPLSPTLEINETSRRLIAEGKEVFRLGLGQSPFPVPEQVVQALRENAEQKDYLSVRGLEALRVAIADYHNRRYGLAFNWRNILIGPGSKELMFLLQLVYYGDLVIPVPSWVSYAPQANIVGRPVRWVQTKQENGWIITPDDLERVCSQDPTKPRILILNYPNNPTGKSYRDSTLKELAEAARKYHVILLSDEIYGELDFNGEHTSIAKYYPEGTIISGGLSKWCGAGGWRLGMTVFPEQLTWLLEGMAAVASETFTSTSAPIQHAAITAFEGGDWLDEYLNQSRLILRSLSGFIYDALQQVGIQVVKPEGGFYLFPDFSTLSELLAKRHIYDSETLCKRLLEDTGVALLPGSAFGLAPEELLARLAFVDFDGSACLGHVGEYAGQDTLPLEFLEKYCPKVVTATLRICDWLAQES